jgi:hypothetical protein
MTNNQNSEIINPEIKDILKSKLEELKATNCYKHSKQDLPQCDYISIKGIQCPNKCTIRDDDTKLRCHVHVKSVDVVQCSFITKDENGNDIQCPVRTRSKGGKCYDHSITDYNKIHYKKYYEKNKEKLLREKRLSKLIVRVDKLVAQIDEAINHSD